MGSEGVVEKNAENPKPVCLSVIVKHTHTQTLPTAPMGPSARNRLSGGGGGRGRQRREMTTASPTDLGLLAKAIEMDPIDHPQPGYIKESKGTPTWPLDQCLPSALSLE